MKYFFVEIGQDDRGDEVKFTTSSSSKESCLKTTSDIFNCPESHIKLTEIFEYKGGK
jgi:hypothetical protein